MKIEWNTILAVLIALVVFKLVDKFALSKVEFFNLDNETAY
jgi:hypothetical protein